MINANDPLLPVPDNSNLHHVPKEFLERLENDNPKPKSVGYEFG